MPSSAMENRSRELRAYIPYTTTSRDSMQQSTPSHLGTLQEELATLYKTGMGVLHPPCSRRSQLGGLRSTVPPGDAGQKRPVGPESPTLQRGIYGEGQLQCPASPRTTQGEAAPTIRIPHSPIPGHSVSPERTLISVTATQCPPTEARRSAGSLPELQCRFTRCRYLHICSDWSRPHAAIHCPQHRATPVNRGPPEPELKKLTQDIIELHHLNQAVVSISRSCH